MKKRIHITLNAKAFLGIFILLSTICAIVYSILIINIPASFVNNFESAIKKEIDTILEKNFVISSLDELETLMKPISDKYHINITISDHTGDNLVTVVKGIPGENDTSLDYMDMGYIAYTKDTQQVYLINAYTPPGQDIRIRDVLISQIPVMFCIVLGLSIGSSFLVARIITKPISKLSETSIQLANQEEAEVPYLHRRDEIGQLANNLFDMYKGLQQSLENEQHQRLLRDKLFQSVSHELKTPITILQGELEGMLYNMGDYKDRDTYIGHSLEVVQDMAKLVHKILEISKNSIIYKITETDLSQLVFTQCQRYTPLANQKNIELLCEAGSNIMIHADIEAFSRVISNLLINAIKYSPANATVEVNVSEHSLYIENSGVSLPEDSIDDLFEPFVRLEESHNRMLGGSGLGLYFVKSILDAHSMTYELANTISGVRFTIQY